MSQTLKQAIPGVSPSNLGEVTIMTVWPTVASTWLGRALGRLYESFEPKNTSEPDSLSGAMSQIFCLRNLVILATIPGVLKAWVWTILPFRCLRYRLTNRRVIIARGYTAKDVASVPLDQFDAIDVETRPGAAVYSAGDLVFRRGTVETFRLTGVSRPHAFRNTCLAARNSYVGVQSWLKQVSSDN